MQGKELFLLKEQEKKHGEAFSEEILRSLQNSHQP
jgi:hypothetical protein